MRHPVACHDEYQGKGGGKRARARGKVCGEGGGGGGRRVGGRAEREDGGGVRSREGSGGKRGKRWG